MALDGNPPQPPPSADDVPDGRSPPRGRPREQRSRTTRADVVRFIHAVRDSDDAVVDDAVMRLSRARLWLAPLPPGVRALNAKTAALAAIEAPEVCLEWSSSQAFGYDTEAALGDPSGH